MEQSLLVDITKFHYHLEKTMQIYQSIVHKQKKDLPAWREN